MKRSQKNNQLLNATFSLIGLVVFLSFFIVTVWGNDGLMRLVELKNMRDVFAVSNLNLLHENLFFKQSINRLHQAKYLEQKSRSDLGLVRPNEHVFIIR